MLTIKLKYFENVYQVNDLYTINDLINLKINYKLWRKISP